MIHYFIFAFSGLFSVRVFCLACKVENFLIFWGRFFCFVFSLGLSLLTCYAFVRQSEVLDHFWDLGVDKNGGLRLVLFV